MVKIEEFFDAAAGDCCEIDAAEFAKKVNLKASDDDEDVVIVAAKRQMIKVKLEVDESVVNGAAGFSGFFKREPGCLGSTSGIRHGCACGDSMDNPYDIDDEDVPVSCEESVTPDISPPVKCQPEDCSGGGEDGEEEDASDRLPEEIIPHNLPVSLAESVIPNMSPPPPPPPVKCESEDCSGRGENGEEEDAYDHLPELLNTGGRVFDEEDDDDVVVVGRGAL